MMQKRVSTLAGVIIIIVVAVVAFGGVFAYQYFTKSQIPNPNPSASSGQNDQNQNTQTENQQTDDVQTIDQTAGWKTYTNDDWGIEFKYPVNFGVLNVDPTINLLSFRDKKNENKINIMFLEKTTLEDIEKCKQECEQCQKDGTCQICIPCTSPDYWQTEKDFIKNNNVGEIECFSNKFNTHPSAGCEIKMVGGVKMLIEHDVWTPGGLIDARTFYNNDTIFKFLPNEDYVDDFFTKYNTDEKTMLSTFKFTQ